jgi:hypothetical protein
MLFISTDSVAHVAGLAGAPQAWMNEGEHRGICVDANARARRVRRKLPRSYQGELLVSDAPFVAENGESKKWRAGDVLDCKVPRHGDRLRRRPAHGPSWRNRNPRLLGTVVLSSLRTADEE